MVELAGWIVGIVGRLDAVPSRLVAAEVVRRGGVVRRGLSRRTGLVVIGHGALRQLADGRLQDKLERAAAAHAPCLSENAFLRELRLLPPLPSPASAILLEDLPAQAGLSGDVVRLLVLFDVLQPVDDRCSFRDLVAAREVARLLRERLRLADILEGSGRLAHRDGVDQPLTRLKLVGDGGRLARRIGDCIAELDGQLRLALADPASPTADELFEAAEEAEQAGDLAAAESSYRRCIDADRTDPIALFNLANVLRERGSRGEAKLILQQALELDPGFAEAWYNLAGLLHAGGQRHAARRCLERAIAADPDYADPLYNLAQLRFEAGDLERAADLWRRYLRLDPDSEWSRRARHGLALCRRKAGGRSQPCRTGPQGPAGLLEIPS
jgi:tetratricopeptide (TPR) repeat protein